MVFKCRISGHIDKYCRNNKQDAINHENDATRMTLPDLVVCALDAKKSSLWMSEFGCTRHISDSSDCLINFELFESIVQAENNETVPLYKNGAVKIFTMIKCGKQSIAIQNVIFVPEITLIWNSLHLFEIVDFKSVLMPVKIFLIVKRWNVFSNC